MKETFLCICVQPYLSSRKANAAFGHQLMRFHFILFISIRDPFLLEYLLHVQRYTLDSMLACSAGGVGGGHTPREVYMPWYSEASAVCGSEKERPKKNHEKTPTHSPGGRGPQCYHTNASDLLHWYITFLQQPRPLICNITRQLLVNSHSGVYFIFLKSRVIYSL